MCCCGHGSDRHYLDYAGPDVCGGVLSRCLEKDCPCKLFREASSWTTWGPLYYQIRKETTA